MRSSQTSGACDEATCKLGLAFLFRRDEDGARDVCVEAFIIAASPSIKAARVIEDLLPGAAMP